MEKLKTILLVLIFSVNLTNCVVDKNLHGAIFSTAALVLWVGILIKEFLDYE